jgi:hypothetical protein
MKTMQQIPNLSNIKSARSTGATSVPKVQRPGHLELYVLGMQKGVLEKELSALDKRRGTVKKRLDGINERIEKLHKETYDRQRSKSCENTPMKPLKTLSINY